MMDYGRMIIGMEKVNCNNVIKIGILYYADENNFGGNLLFSQRNRRS